MHEQVGLRGLLQRLKKEAPRYAKLLPELPRLIHDNLQNSNDDLRLDLAAILREQRKTNRLLSAVVWVALGFVLGLVSAQVLMRLHVLGIF